jgi:hypothetical protein
MGDSIGGCLTHTCPSVPGRSVAVHRSVVPPKSVLRSDTTARLQGSVRLRALVQREIAREQLRGTWSAAVHWAVTFVPTAYAPPPRYRAPPGAAR